MGDGGHCKATRQPTAEGAAGSCCRLQVSSAVKPKPYSDVPPPPPSPSKRRVATIGHCWPYECCLRCLLDKPYPSTPVKALLVLQQMHNSNWCNVCLHACMHPCLLACLLVCLLSCLLQYGTYHTGTPAVISLPCMQEMTFNSSKTTCLVQVGQSTKLRQFG